MAPSQMGFDRKGFAEDGVNQMFIEVNGATYAYRVQGSGEPLVLLHGFTGSQATWNDFVQQWKHSFQVVTIDLFGHGQTTATFPKTMEMMVDDLHEILKHLGIFQAHILGYSMGGRTALAYASTYPETVLTLTLESASPGLATEQERAERRQKDRQIIQRLERDGLKSFVHFWENIPLFATQKDLPEHVQEKVRQERLAQSASGLIDSLRYMGTGQQTSLWNNLHSLHCPVLLIVGKDDQKFVNLNIKMHTHLPQATLEILEGAGHTVHLEQPKKFYETVHQFIQKSKKH